MDTFLGPEVRIYLALFGLFFLSISFFNVTLGLILLTLAMLFSPEFTVGSLGFRDVTIRAEDILIPLLVAAWLARIALRRESRLFVASPLNLPILSIVGLSIFSTTQGITAGTVSSPLIAFFYIAKTMEFFAIFFLVLNYIRTESGIRRFLFYVILVVVLIGIYTLFQIPSIEIFTEKRITAPFEGSPEPASIGGYMAFLLLIIISIFLYERHAPRKWLYGLIVAIVFIPFLYTLNRTSYLALLAGLFFIALVERRKQFVFFILAFLVISPILLPTAVKDRIAFTWKDGVGERRDLGVDASFQERIYAFRKLWVVSELNVIIGTGVCSWGLPDSQYARTLQEIGLLGLVLWIWIFMRLFRMSKWLFESLEGGLLKGFLLGYRAGLLGIVVHGFGAVTLYIVRIMEPFWFISGLVVSLYLVKIQEQESMEEKSLEEVSA